MHFYTQQKMGFQREKKTQESKVILRKQCY
jgi:hypothetical protein